VEETVSTDAEVEIGPGRWDMTVLWLKPEQLVPNVANPNQQDDATFNALVRSIRQDGWSQVVTAVAIGEVTGGPEDRYQIVAGEHRWRAAQIIDCEVPVLPLPPSQWVDDRQKWMLVKDNILTGKLNPVKFAQLYEEMAARYDAEVLQSLMGFTSSDAFQKVYKETRDALPPEMQKALPSNVMVFTWGKRKVFWVLADKRLWTALEALQARVTSEGYQTEAAFADALETWIEQEAATDEFAATDEGSEVCGRRLAATDPQLFGALQKAGSEFLAREAEAEA
jgi:hypothetical protein